MAEKSVHIVFKVLNFLYSNESRKYKLLPNDERILINLSHHNGPKGICPSATTMSKELHISERYVRERLSHLEGLNLIKINQTLGKKNSYDLLFLSTAPEPQFTPLEKTTPEPQFRGPLNPSSETPEPQFRTIITTKDQQRINKERVREKSIRALSLPVSFSPNQEHHKICSKKNLNIEAQLEKFFNYHQSKKSKRKDWDATFQKWLLAEKQIQKKNLRGDAKMSNVENRSNSFVPFQFKKTKDSERIAKENLTVIKKRLPRAVKKLENCHEAKK